MARRLRIVILDTSNPDEMTGGQSVFIRNLIPRLDADVRVVGVLSGSESLGQWRRRSLRGVAYDFLPVARLSPPGRAPLVPQRLSTLLGVARYRSRILAAGDVVYVHSLEMALPLVVGTRRRPLAVHIHGAANPLSVSRYPWARGAALRGVYSRVQHFVLSRSTLVLSVDQAGLDLASASIVMDGRTQTALLPVCVDTDLFARGEAAAARRALGLPPDARIMVFVGRLERAKGTERLVEAFATLASQDESVRLVLIGDGSQRPSLAAQARALGVLDRVVFAGWVDHDELPTWLQASDVLLLPSDDEGLPTVVIEALSCGVPVVATAVGALPTLITDGENGFLLRGRTADELASVTAKALCHPWVAEELTASVAVYSAGNVAASVGALLAEAAACGHS